MKSIILLSAVFLSYTATAQPLKQRVVAESEYFIPGSTLVDSVHYKYSYNRGSTYKYGTKRYDYQYYTAFNPGGGDRSYYTPDVAADSVWVYNFASAPMVLRVAAEYNGLKIISYYDLDTFKNDVQQHIKNVCEYDAQGRIVKRTVMELKPSASTWTVAGKTTFRYDFQGRHVFDSTFRPYESTNTYWQFIAMVPHHYDAAWNETETSYSVAPGWDYKERFRFTYYPDHKLETVVEHALTSAVMNVTDPIRRDSFAYDNGMDFYTRKWSWKSAYPGGMMKPTFYEERSLNAQNLPDTVRYFAWSAGVQSWLPVEDVVFTYNSKLNPKSWTAM